MRKKKSYNFSNKYTLISKNVYFPLKFNTEIIMKNLLVFIFLCLLSSSCSTFENFSDQQPQKTTQYITIPPEYISSKDWKLKEAKTGFFITDVSSENIILYSNGSITIYDGNNTHSQRLEAGENNSIKVISQYSTQRGEPPGFVPKNAEIRNTITRVNNFVIDNNSRLLLRKDNEVLLVFI
jgi:hypothetical protein